MFARIRTDHPLAFALVAFVVATWTLMSLGGETFYEQARQEAGAAAVAWVVIFASQGRKLPAQRPGRSGVAMAALVLAAAIAGGLLFIWGGLNLNESFYVLIPRELSLTHGRTLGAAVTFFALVALFEEGLFRGIFCPCLALELRKLGEPLPTLKAALATASIFAVMHLFGQGALRIEAIAVAQAACKLLEALFFGLTMTGLMHSTKRLWPCVAAHLIYNLLSQGPMALQYGVLPATYLTGLPEDLAAMAASMLVLAPAVIISCRFLASLDRP